MSKIFAFLCKAELLRGEFQNGGKELQDINGNYYNKIIYCYVEEQNDELDRLISKYNDESIIHIITSVIESCESKLIYCLCDIITNYIEDNKEADTEFLFVTDVEDLYNIVKKLYSAIFNEIIYIGQGNNKKFDNGLEMDEFVNYFLSVQRSVLNASFMRRLWDLKDCVDIDKFTSFLYELDRLEIRKDKFLITQWCCLCEILLYGLGDNLPEGRYLNYKLALYSILMVLSNKSSYAASYLKNVLESNSIQADNMYFVWYQFKRMGLKGLIVPDKETSLLQNKLYEKTYQLFADRLSNYLVKIPIEERNRNLVMITTIQFLNETHAPTKTVLERAKALKKLGKDVVIVNTTEQYIIKGYVPMYSAGFGRTLEEYNNINEIKLGEDRFPFMQMPENSPVGYRMQLLSELLIKYKPYYILSIGTGSILADLCGNIVPCASMALAFSTLPKTINKMKIIGRKLSEEEKEHYAGDDIDIIESKFTFELKPQKKKFSRKGKNLPDNKFLLVVVGIRLEFEIDSKFMDMLSEVCNKGCYVVFAGIMDNYDSLMEEYPAVSGNSSFIGYCDDILALMEICDLYVNPGRLGGGFSVIEAFAKGKPGVYLNRGDVYTAGGADFAVRSFDEMAKQIIKYKDDKKYYNTMSGLAKDRAKLMTSSKEAIEDIDRQICQRVKEKYW
ncbi:MAG: glycosyltransferase family 4 protein [Lachnospiraceae bacterium]|nr:glycosyltransferase family 4 protein [Lachnospiraceae bacterium]